MASNKILLLAQEQTILSRERTMQQYVSTGLAFIAVGLVITQLFGEKYILLGYALIGYGFWQIYHAMQRFRKYRNAVIRLRKKEAKSGLEVGE